MIECVERIQGLVVVRSYAGLNLTSSLQTQLSTSSLISTLYVAHSPNRVCKVSPSSESCMFREFLSSCGWGVASTTIEETKVQRHSRYTPWSLPHCDSAFHV